MIFLGKCLWLDQLQGRLVEAAFPGQRRAAGHALHGSFAETLGWPKVVKGPSFMKMGVEPMQDMVMLQRNLFLLMWLELVLSRQVTSSLADQHHNISGQCMCIGKLEEASIMGDMTERFTNPNHNSDRCKLLKQVKFPRHEPTFSHAQVSLSLSLCAMYIYIYMTCWCAYVYTYTCTFFFLSNYLLDKCFMQVV